MTETPTNQTTDERLRTLHTAVLVVASAIRVKHAHYEDCHTDPRPRRLIPVDEANWRRLLEAALEGAGSYVQSYREAQLEVENARLRALLAEARPLLHSENLVSGIAGRIDTALAERRKSE
jgi:hypothetical protein